MLRYIPVVCLMLFLSIVPAHAVSVTADITAQNTFTDSLTINPASSGATTRVSISVSNTFSGTVTFQRRLDSSNWRDVKNWTTVAEETYITDEKVDIRIGIKTGNYSSGTATLRLGVGR